MRIFLLIQIIFVLSLNAALADEHQEEPVLNTSAQVLGEATYEPFSLATSSEIALSPEMSVALGVGYNSLQGVFRASATELVEADVVSLAISANGLAREFPLDQVARIDADAANGVVGQQIRYQFDYAENLYQLRESLRVSAEAAFGGSNLSVSASASFFSSFTLEERASYIVFSMSVVNAMQRLNSCQLNDTAMELANAGEFGRFISTFGDEYVSSITTGGDLSIVFEVVSSTVEEKRGLDAAFKVGYGAFSGSASIEQRFSELLADKQVNVRFLKRGGDEGIFTTDTIGDVSAVVIQIFKLAEEFPAEVRENPIQVAATTSDYNSCLGANRVLPTFYQTRQVIQGVVGLLETYGSELEDYQLCIQTSLSAGCLPKIGGVSISNLQSRVLQIYRDPFYAEANPQGGRDLLNELENLLRVINLPPPPQSALIDGQTPESE